MEKKVSIIIPTYNYGRFLPETLNCLLAQAHQHWEALIIDDGSTDDTESILIPFLKQDNRILYFHQENKGVSSARNLGLRYASGEYIQFLDADDLLSEQKLSLQLSFLEANPGVDICYTENHYFMDGKPSVWYPDLELQGNTWMPILIGENLEAVKTLTRNNIAVVSSPLFRSRIVEKVSGFPEKVAYTEDWQFWFDCAFQGFRFHYFPHPEAYTLIRVHQKSVSQNPIIMRYGVLNLRHWVNKMINKSNFEEKEKQELILLNDIRKSEILKYLLYYGPLLDFGHLAKVAQLEGWPKVVKYYFKALNFRRKSVNKNARNRRHHPVKC